MRPVGEQNSNWLRAICLALAVALVACSSSPGPGLEVDRVMGHVAALAGGPRAKDSDASRAAAAYIEGQLDGIAVERMQVGDVDLPAITVLGNTYREAHRVSTSDPNLVVRFGPPGKALLVMAHYDTVATSPGATDNAAAVGVLIELARTLREQPPAVPSILAFTANEEIGLVGAEAFAARRGDTVDFAIALDLVGGSGTLIVNGASDLIGKAEMRWLAEAAERAGITLRAPLAHRVVSRWWPQAERSDHGPFTRRGIRAVHLYNRGQDGDWIDLAYHGQRDVPARVHRESLDEVGRFLRALVTTKPPAHDGDGFWLPVAPNTIVPRWLLIVACLALAGAAIIGLVRLRGPRIAHGKLGLLAGLACYAIAIAVTFGIERASARWIHHPLRAVIAEGLVLAGTFGFLTVGARRLAPWTGERRYLLVAIAPPIAIGLVMLPIGAAELAWIWLLPAAIAALAPRPIGIIALALPPILVLAPGQLREAAWNGFLPPGIPLVVWLVLLGSPVIAATASWIRRFSQSGPLGTFVLPVGWLLAGLFGAGLALAASEACSDAQFLRFGLACEVVTGLS